MPDATFLETKEVKIGDLTPHPANPNRGSVNDIAESLEQHGQYRSIVANKDGTILAGHHVWQAAKNIGMKTIRVDFVDVDEKAAKKILLADNRLADLGLGPDLDALLSVLDDLDGDLIGTGFDNDYLEMLRETTGGPPSLDDLEDEAGPSQDDDFFHRVVLVLEPELADIWKQHREGFESDNDAFQALISDLSAVVDHSQDAEVNYELDDEGRDPVFQEAATK